MGITNKSKFTYAISTIDDTFSMYNQPVIGTTLAMAIKEVLTSESQININDGLTKISHITIHVKPNKLIY